MDLLQAQGLTCRFGEFIAVKGVDLAVPQGEIRALIGPNGAGKSTLLNMLAGTLAPNEGRIHFGGEDITRLPVHARARRGINRSYQVVSLFSGLTCRQVLQLAVQRDRALPSWLSARGVAACARKAEALLERAGLAEFADMDSTTISHGLQKRLEIALALVNESRVLLLDEPMAGMTASERAELRGLLRGLAGKRTIIFVEHDMEMVMTLAERVTVLHNGTVIAEGGPEEVRGDAAARSAYLGHD
jgi:branched-chain amino acid transport system ATP-binding protein